LQKKDANRDVIFSDFRGLVKHNLGHWDENKAEAARRLMIVCDHYKGMKTKGYREQSLKMYNFLQEINEKHSADVATLDLQACITKLDELNEDFRGVIDIRDKEKSEKPQLSITDIRKNLDNCYGNLARCLEAKSILENDSNTTALINIINSKVTYYNNTLAIRKGKAEATASKKEIVNQIGKPEN
jgi:hypothetical protein